MSYGTVLPIGNYFKIEFKPLPAIVAAVKELPERRWLFNEKYWQVPLRYRDEVERFAKVHKLDFGHKPIAENTQVFTIPPLPELTINVPLKPHFVLRPYQERGIAYGLAKKRFINGDDMGLGKQNINGTPVLTEKGWLPIETLSIGDKLYGRDGKLHNVTGVFPQGIRDIYRVTFSDKTFSDVGLEHLWAVRSLNDRRISGGKWRVLSTEEINKKINYKNGSPIWEIPLVEPIDYPEKQQLIDPYILGVLIADGAIKKIIRFVPGDKEVPLIVKSKLPWFIKLSKGADYGTSTSYGLIFSGQANNNPWIGFIRQMKLNVTGEHKFIPYRYLNGSIQQRKDLLAGLLDCDGTVAGARVRYSTSSLKLAEDVKTLVQSLGGIAVISKVDGRERVRDGRSCTEMDNYQVSVRVSFNPFIRESNRRKWKLSSKLIRQITSIEYIGKYYATCISVDAKDSLYITDNFIVTHNTAMAIATVIAAGNFPILVICPSAVKENWKRSIEGISHKKAIVLQDSIRNTFTEFHRVGMADFFITNYESLQKFFVESINKPKTGRFKITDIVFKTKYLEFFKAVIVDECHRIKDSKTQLYKFTRGITMGKEMVIGLTGTMVVNKPIDLVAQLTIINRLPEFGGYSGFKQQYCAGPKEASNLSELNYKLNTICYFRRNKSDPEIKAFLPDKSRQIVVCELSDFARKEYRHAQANLESYLSEVRGKSDDQIEKSMKGEVMVRIGILKNISARGKLKDAFDFIHDLISQGQKVVVFANLRDVIAEVQAKFPKSVRITGLEDPKQKQDSVDRFKADPNIQVIVCSIKAAGTGVDGLQDIASEVVFIEMGWHAAVMDQAEDRLYRSGQHKNVMCTYFIGKDTIDDWNYKLIESKRSIANSVTGAEDDVNVSFIDDVINLFTK